MRLGPRKAEPGGGERRIIKRKNEQASVQGSRVANHINPSISIQKAPFIFPAFQQIYKLSNYRMPQCACLEASGGRQIIIISWKDDKIFQHGYFLRGAQEENKIKIKNTYLIYVTKIKKEKIRAISFFPYEPLDMDNSSNENVVNKVERGHFLHKLQDLEKFRALLVSFHFPSFSPERNYSECGSFSE